MSRTSILWMEEHERAVERFTTGQITSIEFVTALEKLGMEANDVLAELRNDANERAAYAAEAEHYGKLPSYEEAMKDAAKARILFDASKGGNVCGITEDHRYELANVFTGSDKCST